MVRSKIISVRTPANPFITTVGVTRPNHGIGAEQEMERVLYLLEVEEEQDRTWSVRIRTIPGSRPAFSTSRASFQDPILRGNQLKYYQMSLINQSELIFTCRYHRNKSWNFDSSGGGGATGGAIAPNPTAGGSPSPGRSLRFKRMSGKYPSAPTAASRRATTFRYD